MRRLPIDTSAISFAIAEVPRRVNDFDTKQPKTNENGEQLWSVNIAATATDGISIIGVKVFGLSARLVIGETVTIAGLAAQPWVNDGRSGISYSADRIESLAKSTAKAA